MLRRIAGVLTATALAATGLAALAASPSAVGAPTQQKLTPTAYAMEASGYASRVKGGEVPAGSDRSAYQVVACTNEAGHSKVNSEAAVALGAGMSLDTTRTHTWTTKQGGTVTSHSRHTVAKVTLADTPLGSLYLSGVVSSSRAWHDASGFGSAATSKLGSIVLDPATGDDQSFPVPSPGQSLPIPGVATISLGAGVEKSAAHSASAVMDAVKIKLHLSGTVFYVGHSRATIQDGITTGMYGGSSYATKVDALEGTVSSGRTPATLVPCVGSDGAATKKAIAHADLQPGLAANGLKSSQRSGETNGGRPEVTTRASIARIDLGGGLVIEGISAAAHVAKTASGYERDSAGTRVATITFNGEEQVIPVDAPLVIPGVASIEPAVVHKTARGITVIALRVTVLDGRLAVINLGYARAVLSPSGL